MAIVYATSLKNTRLQAVVTALGNNSQLVIGTDALNGGATGVLASIPLANPPATVTGGVLTLANLPRTTTATGTGVAAKAELRSSSGSVVASNLVVDDEEGQGIDVVINALEVSSGQSVQVSAGTIIHG